MTECYANEFVNGGPIDGKARQLDGPFRLKDYLRRFHGERTPDWLERYSRFSRTVLADFFRSRLVYYPGARFDLDPLEAFGRSGSAHCFVLVDYLMPESELQEHLDKEGFEGYHVYDSVGISEREMFAVVQPGRFHLSGEELRDAAERSRMFNPIPPYARLVVFERNEDEPDETGPRRLAVLFLAADGIATYDVMFASRPQSNLFAILLQDHGFGGNWDYFGRGGLCEEIASRSGVYPPFVLAYGDDYVWQGYERVTEIADDSTSPRGRSLYRRR